MIGVRKEIEWAPKDKEEKPLQLSNRGRGRERIARQRLERGHGFTK